jgi:alanyl-tRNA synthetase
MCPNCLFVCALRHLLFFYQNKKGKVSILFHHNSFLYARKSLTGCFFGYRFALPADTLWVSFYEDDNEAFELWHDEVNQTRAHNVITSYWGFLC